MCLGETRIIRDEASKWRLCENGAACAREKGPETAMKVCDAANANATLVQMLRTTLES